MSFAISMVTWDRGGDERDAYLAFLLEYTGLPRAVIHQVLDANDRYWDLKMAQWRARTVHGAHGEPWDDDAVESDGG